MDGLRIAQLEEQMDVLKQLLSEVAWLLPGPMTSSDYNPDTDLSRLRARICVAVESLTGERIEF